MLAVSILAYNEAEWIEKAIKQWLPLVDKVQVLVSTKPWHGIPQPDDGTADIARKAGAEVIVEYWQTEAQQRNWSLANLYDYDYVIIADADEFYSPEDLEKIIDTLKTQDEPCFRCPKVTTYWKTTDYVFFPPDKHEPIIAINPRKVKFSEHRQPQQIYDNVLQEYQPVIDVEMHHMSWAKSDEKVREKIQSFSHAGDISLDWYHDVWLKWTPGSSMEVRPYGHEKSIAKYKPLPIKL